MAIPPSAARAPLPVGQVARSSRTVCVTSGVTGLPPSPLTPPLLQGRVGWNQKTGIHNAAWNPRCSPRLEASGSPRLGEIFALIVLTLRVAAYGPGPDRSYLAMLWTKALVRMSRGILNRHSYLPWAIPIGLPRLLVVSCPPGLWARPAAIPGLG
eukprot:2939661-Rhodomonas_salina.2